MSLLEHWFETKKADLFFCLGRTALSYVHQIRLGRMCMRLPQGLY